MYETPTFTAGFKELAIGMPAHIQSLAERAVAGRRGWSGPVGMTMTSAPPEPPAPPAPTPPVPAPPAPSDAPVEATDDQGRGLGFPKDTPTEKMDDGQKAAYWRNQSRTQERERRAWESAFPGKKPEELQALIDAATKATQTEQERAIAEAEKKGREAGQQVGSTTAAEETAMLLLESYLENRVEDEDRRKILLNTVDPKRGLGDDGKVSADKVRAMAEALAPKVDGTSGGGGGRVTDVGGGRRTTSTSSGVAAGKALFEELRGKAKSTTE